MVRRVYISVSLQRAPHAEWVEHELTRHGYEVSNPCRIDLPDGPKEEYPASVALACYQLIDDADAVVLLADYYGRDCAAEVGYAYAIGRPVVALLQEARESHLLQTDWMLRPVVSRLTRSIPDLLAALDQAGELARSRRAL